MPALPVWRPIPRLHGKSKRVCSDCALLLDAQGSLEEEALRAANVDRAVRTRKRALARLDSPFRPPVDVADVAEDQGHPLAVRSGT